MAAKPPPIPELVYRRVILVGKVHGYTVLVAAGMMALFFAMGGFWGLAFAACLAAGTGAMESHGAGLLARGDEKGMDWLVRAQLLLLLVVLSFVTYYLFNFNEAFFSEMIPELRARAAETYPRFGMADPYPRLSDADLLLVMRLGQNMTLVMIGLMSCVYQGLMARYYHRRRAAISQALDILCGEE